MPVPIRALWSSGGNSCAGGGRPLTAFLRLLLLQFAAARVFIFGIWLREAERPEFTCLTYLRVWIHTPAVLHSAEATRQLAVWAGGMPTSPY